MDIYEPLTQALVDTGSTATAVNGYIRTLAQALVDTGSTGTVVN
jgi:hypothetical protein